MFDTNSIAKKIKTARIKKNMTQTELADVMGIRYQAVSNWERGNSMPDISKLSELCQILELSLDELLGNDNAASTVKKMVTQENSHVTLNELSMVAPIVSPQKVEKILEDNKGVDTPINLDAFVSLAPFLEEDILDEIIRNHTGSFEGSLNPIIGLAPFLTEGTLDFVVDKYLSCNESVDLDGIVGLCPFLDATTVKKIMDYCISHKQYDKLTAISVFAY